MKFPYFPKDQIPVLEDRLRPGEHIIISWEGVEETQVALATSKENRAKAEQAVLRFEFDSPITQGDLDFLADTMKQAMSSNKSPWTQVRLVNVIDGETRKFDIMSSAVRQWQASCNVRQKVRWPSFMEVAQWVPRRLFMILTWRFRRVFPAKESVVVSLANSS